jgi:hypothetical protein
MIINIDIWAINNYEIIRNLGLGAIVMVIK